MSANCSLTASDLRYSHPGVPTIQICDKPLDVPLDVNLWGYDFTTKRLVTAEDPAELRIFDAADVFFEYNLEAPASSASEMPPEYGLTCVKPAMSFPDASALFFPPSSKLFRAKEPCPAQIVAADGRPDPRWLAAPSTPGGTPSKQAAKKPQALVRVCARPAGIGSKVDRWASRDSKGNLLTNNDKVFADAVAKAELVFIFDEKAPPESVYWFVKDPAELSCPNQPPPQPYKEAKAAGRLEMMATATSLAAGCGVTPQQLAHETSWTSSPDGHGPPLNFLETLAHNLAIAGALASGDTSGSLKDPNGSRYGIPAGKNVGGPDLLILQAAAGTFAIIGIPVKSGKQFIQEVTRALSQKKVAGILDPKVLSKEIAEQLAADPGKEAIKDAIDALKRGEELSLESFGKAMAPSLREASVILPYSRAKIFTRGWEGKFQAHHILEVDMMEQLKLGAAEDAPAIILSEADHQVITTALDKARADFRSTMGREINSPQELWQIYQKVYAKYPSWLEAIKGYFPNVQ